MSLNICKLLSGLRKLTLLDQSPQELEAESVDIIILISWMPGRLHSPLHALVTS